MSTVLRWWTFAMVCFPEAQHRAQEELDSVVGQGRIPSFTDVPHLTYVTAILREIVRWRPSLPLSLPHTAEEDDWYEGMFIPKGTICFPNVLPCNHDTEIYGADASTFNPDRFLDEKGNLKPTPPATKDEGHVSFGFGRRICVGRHVAIDSLTIATATLLWAFRFDKTKDTSGMDVPINTNEYEAAGMTLNPVPYGCSITPRFDEAILILTNEKEMQGK